MLAHKCSVSLKPKSGSLFEDWEVTFVRSNSPIWRLQLLCLWLRFCFEQMVRYVQVYFYNENQRDAPISQVYIGIELYMFRTGLLSIIRSLVLYTQQYVRHIPIAVYTLLDSWWWTVNLSEGGLRWSIGVSVLASGTQVRGFKPGWSRRIFKGGKILRTPCFGREVKPCVPCRRFAACKRGLKCTVEVGI
jgi:hypothetical protein